MFGLLGSALAFHTPPLSRRQVVAGFLSTAPGLALLPTRTSAAEGPQTQLAALVKAQADLAALEVPRVSPVPLFHTFAPDQLCCHSRAGAARIRTAQEQRRRRHGRAPHGRSAAGRHRRADEQGAGVVADARCRPAVARVTGRYIFWAAGARAAAQIRGVGKRGRGGRIGMIRLCKGLLTPSPKPAVACSGAVAARLIVERQRLLGTGGGEGKLD
jgi:hypothetical protein